MGTVFKARNTSGNDEIVALKLLKTSLAESEIFVARFFREAEAAKSFSHPSLVTAFDYGVSDGYHYYAMEYINGEEMVEFLRRGQSLTEQQALNLAQAIGEGIRHAWQKKIVHRDIKPANIMVEPNGRLRLMDMGLAKEVGEGGSTVTQAGSVLGTPAYAAPEQLRGETQVDTRADLYALGTTLFHLVCGRQPFLGDTAAIVGSKQLSDPLPDPRELKPEMSEGFCNLLFKLTQKEPQERYQTPDELLEAVENVRSGDTLSTGLRLDREKLAEARKRRKSIKKRPKMVSVVMFLLLIGTAGYIYYEGWIYLTNPEGKHTSTSKKGNMVTTGDGRIKVSKAYIAATNVEGTYNKIIKLARNKRVTLNDLLSGLVTPQNDGRMMILYSFNSYKQYLGWGFRGQGSGKLICWGEGGPLKVSFASENLEIHWESILIDGQGLSVTVFDSEDPLGLSAKFSMSASKGFSLETWTKKTEPLQKNVAKDAVIKFNQPVTCSIKFNKDKIFATGGDNQLQVRAKLPESVSIRVDAQPNTVAAVDNLKVIGGVDLRWAEREAARLATLFRIRHAKQYIGAGANKGLVLYKDSRVSVPVNLTLYPIWTIEMFVHLLRTTAQPKGFPQLFVSRINSGEEDVFEIDPSTMRPRFHMGTAGASVPFLTAKSPLNLGEWHHLAITFDMGKLKMYVDGTLEAEQSVTKPSPKTQIGVVMGGGLDVENEVLIDDFRVSTKLKYKTNFNPRVPLRVSKDTLLLFSFDDKPGKVTRGSTSKKLDGAVTNGRWESIVEISTKANRYFDTLLNREREGIPFEVAANRDWQHTGIYLSEGQKVTIRSRGQWKSAKDESYFEGDGTSRTLGDFARGALVGTIYPSGSPFLISKSTTITVPSSGLLMARMNDREHSDNSGALTILVRTKSHAPPNNSPAGKP